MPRAARAQSQREPSITYFLIICRLHAQTRPLNEHLATEKHPIHALRLGTLFRPCFEYPFDVVILCTKRLFVSAR